MDNDSPEGSQNEMINPQEEPFDDWDLDFEDEGNDLVPILSISAIVAAVIGAFLVLIGRRRNPDPSPKERLESIMGDAGKQGKRSAKQVASAIEGADLGDLLNQALDKARSSVGDFDAEDHLGDLRKAARRARNEVHLSALLSDAVDRAHTASKSLDVEATMKEGRRRGKGLLRSARNATDDIDVEATTRDIRKFAESAFSGARSAAEDFDVEGTAGDVKKRAADFASDVRNGNLDTKGIESVLDMLKERLGSAVDSVRNDVAPKAGDVLPAMHDAVGAVATKVREDLLPTAQGAVDKVREDVLPPAQERIGKLAEDLPLPQPVRKAASSAKQGVGSFGELLRSVGLAAASKLLDEVFPVVRQTGDKAVEMAREGVIPAASQAAQTVREDVLPRVGDVASQAPDVLSDLLKMARARAEEALENAQPFATDALETGRTRMGDAATFSAHRATEAASGVRNVGAGVGGAVGGAVSAVGQGVTGAVGGAVGATVSLTKETTGLLFWLGTLGGLILLVFIPDREKQAEMWNGTLQLLNEVREMWKDLQGDETLGGSERS